MKTCLRALVGAILSLVVGADFAAAQAWPTRPITLVVPFSPGVTSDVIARGLGEHVSAALGQQVVVENRGGAGGNIGAAAVARAEPDGYTLLLATTAQAATNKLMYKSMSYDPQRDFTPVVLLGKAPVVITAGQKFPGKDLAEAIALAKAHPDKLTAGFPGSGTLGHITGILLQQKAAIKLAEAQYRGTGAIITDLLGGHIDLAMDSIGGYVPTVKDGQLRALAIASAQRWPLLPDVPTVAESGIPGFEASVWYALLAPAKTPPTIIARLNAEVNVYLAQPHTRAFLENLGIAPAGGSTGELAQFTAAEIEKWGPIIKAAEIKF